MLMLAHLFKLHYSLFMSEILRGLDNSPNIIDVMDCLQIAENTNVLLSYDSIVYTGNETRRLLASLDTADARDRAAYDAEALSLPGSILSQDTEARFFPENGDSSSFKPAYGNPDKIFYLQTGLPELRTLCATLRKPKEQWNLSESQHYYTDEDIEDNLEDVISILSPLEFLQLFSRVGVHMTGGPRNDVESQLFSLLSPILPQQYQNPRRYKEWFLDEAGSKKRLHATRQLLYLFHDQSSLIRHYLQSEILSSLHVRDGEDISLIYIKKDDPIAHYAAQNPDEPIELSSRMRVTKGRKKVVQAGFRGQFRAGRMFESVVGIALDPELENTDYRVSSPAEQTQRITVVTNELFTLLAVLRDNPDTINELAMNFLTFNERLFALISDPILRQNIFDSIT